ncbi:tetratricopeptide repeat protein [Peribacillus glennii]|uniref:Uncharacterized protein n=1 Tax=Peribacillus glennii TaxID=2303991 RepID=A0A372LJU4_9BACI|nr:hypothetical protein [Peribacillus glennii]RFU66718.1 hypothetical protein D0466_00990 [Peribacillus glennii]
MGLFDFLLGKSKKKATTNVNKTIPNPGNNERNGNQLWLDAMNEVDDEKAENLFLKSEKITESMVDLHFTYLGLYKLYYRRREQWPNALEKCIEYCKKDIEIYPQFIQEYMKESNVEPRVPAFQQLAIIYEKQGKYQAAIEVSQLAIKYSQRDTTKSGYEGRIERLTRKMRKESDSDKD